MVNSEAPMWECKKCQEVVGDELDVCYNCGTTEDGVEDPHFQHAEDIAPETLTSPGIPIPAPVFEDLPPAPAPRPKTPELEEVSTAIQELDDPKPERRTPPKKRSLRCPRCSAD